MEVGPKTTNRYVVIYGAKGNKHGGEKAVRKGRRDIKLLIELNRGRGEWYRDWGGGKKEKGDQDLL